MTLTRHAAAVALFLSVSTLARADFAFTVRDLSGSQQVLQGLDGVVKFRVFGELGSTDVIDTITPYFFYADSIDPQDEITKIARVGGNCGIGSILDSATFCTVKIGFVTDDPRRPLDPDVDYGFWDIGLDITGHQLTDASNLGFGNGVALVAVIDPGANPLPEPGTFALAACAILCLIIRLRAGGVGFSPQRRLQPASVFRAATTGSGQRS
jgi:hypothetical protein